MTAPLQLIKPPIQAYQFVSFMFWEASQNEDRNFWHGEGQLVQPDDESFRAKHFRSPSRVAPAQLAPLAAMSDVTFSQLASIIGLSIDSKSVSTKVELAVECTGQIDEVEGWTNEVPEHYTQEQLQSYLIFCNRAELSPHWGDLADLYNESTDDQRIAIHGFFKSCLNRSLEDLYSVPAPPLEIPSVLREAPVTSEVDGKTKYFSQHAQQWRRDDHYQSSFWIEGRSDDDKELILIATAPSLKEAIALASAYTKGLAEAPEFDRIIIDFDRYEIAEADLVDFKKSDGGYAAKLNWDYEKCKHKAFPKDTVLETALSTEKVLGIQWSKVNRLENDLGM